MSIKKEVLSITYEKPYNTYQSLSYANLIFYKISIKKI